MIIKKKIIFLIISKIWKWNNIKEDLNQLKQLKKNNSQKIKNYSIKKYNEYLQSNIPVIYSKDIDNNIINRFSGFIYKNNSL